MSRHGVSRSWGRAYRQLSPAMPGILCVGAPWRRMRGTGAQPQGSNSGYLHREEARRACRVSWSCHNCAVSHGLGLVAFGLVQDTRLCPASDVTLVTTNPRDASLDPVASRQLLPTWTRDAPEPV
ncbi:hypothetical protein IG631_10177 [Alternaria alternata]|nr:hypothetical protein IG631_10177 [Alternaria alternata]